MSYAYDGLGRVTSRGVGGLTNREKYTYNPGPNGTATTQVQKFEALYGIVTTYEYDVNENIKRFRNLEGDSRYTYDSLGRIIRIDNSDPGVDATEIYEYDGQKLSFINDTSPSASNRYEVTDSDRDVRMNPQIVSVSGGIWELPRKIKLGDSKETLYEAYDGNKGKERTTQGQFLISYDYGESGRIIYHFYTDAMDELVQVTIEWYDSCDREDVSAPSGVPSA